MNKEELIERELEDLDVISEEFRKLVQRTLVSIRGNDVWVTLSEQDSHRLLVLKTWTEKYNVTLKYILSTLLPFWEQFIGKHSKKIRGKGLNVRVATLTGKKSEEMLKVFIKKDFPNDINKIVRMCESQERIIRRAHYVKDRKDTKDSKDSKDKRRTLNGSLTRYVKYYRYSVKKEQKFRDRVISQFKEKPYRTNPFIEGK